jgi:hypothetical protein
MRNLPSPFGLKSPFGFAARFFGWIINGFTLEGTPRTPSAATPTITGTTLSGPYGTYFATNTTTLAETEITLNEITPTYELSALGTAGQQIDVEYANLSSQSGIITIPGPAITPITVNQATSYTSATDATSYSTNRTGFIGTYILAVYSYSAGAGRHVTGVTFDGNAMTRVLGASETSDIINPSVTGQRVSFWKYENVSITTVVPIVVTTNNTMSSLAWSAVNLANADIATVAASGSAADNTASRSVTRPVVDGGALLAIAGFVDGASGHDISVGIDTSISGLIVVEGTVRKDDGYKLFSADNPSHTVTAVSSGVTKMLLGVATVEPL